MKRRPRVARLWTGCSAKSAGSFNAVLVIDDEAHRHWHGVDVDPATLHAVFGRLAQAFGCMAELGAIGKSAGDIITLVWRDRPLTVEECSALAAWFARQAGEGRRGPSHSKPDADQGITTSRMA
jgi:hypothetical protein